MEKRVEWSSLLTNLFFAILYTKFLRTTFFWAPVFALSGISMVPYAAMPSHWHKVKRVFTRFLALPPIVLIGALLSLDRYSVLNPLSPFTALLDGFR